MMATRNTLLLSKSPSDEPCSNAGSLGRLEASAATNKINLVASMPTPVMEISPLEEPNLEEMFPGRSKLEMMRQEKEECEEITRLMAEDLMLAQEEVRQKDVELARKDAEQVKVEKELDEWKEMFRELSIHLMEEKQLITEESIEKVTNTKPESFSLQTKKLLELRDRIASLKGSHVKNEEDLLKLRGQVADQASLIALEKDINTQLREQVEQLTISVNEHKAQKRDTAKQAEYEQEILQKQITRLRADVDKRDSEVVRNQESLHGSEVTNLEKRAQEAEARLQELSTRIATKADQIHSQLLMHTSDLEGKMQDQRRQTEWFKRNSERLSAEIKEDLKKRKVAEQEELAVRSERDDLKEEVRMLRQRHGLAIPGPASPASTYPADAPPASSLPSTRAPPHEDVQSRSLVQQQEDILQQLQPKTLIQQPKQTAPKSSPIDTSFAGRSSTSSSNAPPAPKPCTCDRCKILFPSVNAFRRHLHTCMSTIGSSKSTSLKSPKPFMKG